MEPSPETSESLIARVKDPADAGAWAEFLAIYRPVVYRLARRRMQDADAQDVSQKVLLAVSQAISRFEPGAGQPPFRAWLAKIARKLEVDAFRLLIEKTSSWAQGFSEKAPLRVSLWDTFGTTRLYSWQSTPIPDNVKPTSLLLFRVAAYCAKLTLTDS